MRTLHLISNHKWTGPVEPAVQLCRGLKELGHTVWVGVGTDARGRSDVRERVERYGLPLVDGLRLAKHLKILANRRDAGLLATFVQEVEIPIVHCHQPNDHLVAAAARRRTARPFRIVRTVYDGEGPSGGLRTRFLLARATDALIVVSEAGRDAAIRRFGFAPERVHHIEVGIDLDRFDPRRRLPDLRAAWGVPPDAVVIGAVARVQGRRRFDVLLDAFNRAHARDPRLVLVVVGRGTHRVDLVVDPALAMGIENSTRFPGYLQGDDLVGAYKAFDIEVFLVPGTDGSCRALREAMAMGRPAVVSRHGMLPEIVRHGEEGIVTDDEPEPLAEALSTLAADPRLRERMGAAARRKAEREFSNRREAEEVLKVYNALATEPAGRAFS